MVLGDSGPILCEDGTPHLGKGFAESTFRKYYHALCTLHKHFCKEERYRVSLLTSCHVLTVIWQ